MTYGYINEDGEFVSNDERPRATKCAFCGNIVKDLESEDEPVGRNPTELIHPRVFEELRGDYQGGEPACPDCLRNGIGEPGEDWNPDEVFEEKDEETLEL